MCLNRKRA